VGEPNSDVVVRTEAARGNRAPAVLDAEDRYSYTIRRYQVRPEGLFGQKTELEVDVDRERLWNAEDAEEGAEALQ
jgi:hypothetical protein